MCPSGASLVLLVHVLSLLPMLPELQLQLSSIQAHLVLMKERKRKKEIRPGAWIRKPSQRCKAWGGATVGPKQTKP